MVVQCKSNNVLQKEKENHDKHVKDLGHNLKGTVCMRI